LKKEKRIKTEGLDNVFNRLIVTNFPNLEKEQVPQVQDVYRVSTHRDQKRKTRRLIIIKTVST
jgi:hypothetical protein